MSFSPTVLPLSKVSVKMNPRKSVYSSSSRACPILERSPFCTVRFHRSRSWARCQADTKPMSSDRKSCSVLRSQVCRGRPGGRFQSRGSPEIMDRRTRVWSILLSALAIWPKKRRRILRVWYLTVVMVPHLLLSGCVFKRWWWLQRVLL